MNSYSAVAALISASALLAMPATASTEKLLYSFPANGHPFGRLDQDSEGALYGTGTYIDGGGAVYRLKQRKGVWRYATLFDFSSNRGQFPFAGPLVDQTTGFLYGTTHQGGKGGFGAVYSLAPAGPRWSENVLHSFSNSDGAYPYAMLLKDKASGDLYGTANSGGVYNCGTAFQLAQLNGNWTFSTIYNFQGGNDACYPLTQLKPGAKAGTLIGGSLSGALAEA